MIGHTGGILSVAFSPDGERVASAGAYGEVKVWDATNGQETLALKGHSDQLQVNCVAYSPDGNRLASASHDMTVKVWDATNGQSTLTLKEYTGPVVSVAFSPDGKVLATASADKTVRLWDAKSGQRKRTLLNGLSIVAFSPDGKWLVTGSRDNGAKIWNATTGREARTLKGHTGEVLSVAFSPDGKRLASASADKTVKIWGMGQDVAEAQPSESALVNVPQPATPRPPKATLNPPASVIAAYIIPDRMNGIVTTDPVKLTTVPGYKVSDGQLANIAKSGDGKALEGGTYHLFAIQNRGRMKIRWHGVPIADLLSFRVWNGKSYDLTEVRPPTTTVTIHADVPPSQATVYLLFMNPGADNMNSTDAVIVTPTK